MSEEHDDPQWGEKDSEGDGPNLRSKGDGPNLRLDDFVGQIVQDPNAPPSVTLLSGYLGSSSEEGHVRLYLDEELCRYVEIPEKAIRHTQQLPPEQSPLGGSFVWIDRDAEVLHGAAGAERRKATFLEGQIAQDYIGGAGGIGTSGGGGTDQLGGGSSLTTQTRDCRGVVILPTDMGPGCGQSQFGPCIPPTEFQNCHTRTGIFCTLFGPGCRRTVFEPACTAFGPNCHTIVFNQCQSVYYPCVTQNEPRCVASGFVGCNPPIDFTIYEQPGVFQQFGQQATFAGGGNAGGAQGFAAAPLPTVVCPPPTVSISCQSRFVAACLTRFPNECQLETAVAARCQSRYIRCPTIFELRCQPTRSSPRCLISQIVICGVSQFVACELESAFCGVDPAGGGRGGAARMNITMPTLCEVCGLQTQTRDCSSSQAPACTTPTLSPACRGAEGGGAVAVPQTVYCPSQLDFCPTRYNCPSHHIPCQSQLVRCPSMLDACPTRFNCPTMTNTGCPGHTRFGACETFGACPSAVDACPTRFGCYETQLCGGGFDPGGFGGGFIR